MDAIEALAPASQFSLAGKVAIVTGATGGVGRWIAAGLGAAGASMLLTDLRAEDLNEVQALLEPADIPVRTLPMDLCADEAPNAMTSYALEQFGAIDVLVNCAASNRRKPIFEITHDDFDTVMDVNLRAPYFLSQAVAEVMKSQGAGSIVNVASINSFYGLENVSVYGASKAALTQLTRVMALEWADHGIRANAIAPGTIDTPLAAPLWQDKDWLRWLFNRVPQERMGEPRELVGLCLLLASEAGSFITGQTFVADGGLLAGGRWFHPDS